MFPVFTSISCEDWLGSAQLANFLKQPFNFSNTSSGKFYRLLPGKENTVLCVLPPKKKISCHATNQAVNRFDVVGKMCNITFQLNLT